METIYFQPKGIRPQYCEAGMIHESDPEHIWYLDEPCKILISEVKIIPKENVTYDKKKSVVHRSAKLLITAKYWRRAGEIALLMSYVGMLPKVQMLILITVSLPFANILLAAVFVKL